ncbi:MAG: 2-oxo-4-hydroxy-4-carboxy-5-ureidoimidazoline decarboxylase [Chloroflexi bacterium]|nr:2-oxo-4-hydroxy-4-carboxy-5-ureidoimidazoline decarboxylase [Chloroflexota bacterium]
MTTALDVDALNAADSVDFVAALAPLFEGAPRFLARLDAGRPYADWAALFDRARSLAHEMPERDQVQLIDAHPRLGASPATMSALSIREQARGREAIRITETEAGPAAAGERAPAEPERVAIELDRLNAAYEARFGFRYCVHVAGRTRAELLPDMAAALRAAPDAERHRALDAVVDIARDRVSTLLRPTP